MSILVAGSLHLDVVVTAPHLPALDETVTGQDVAFTFGGKGGNQAVAAAQMGADVSFAGRAGSDSFGDTLRSKLAASGVDTAQLQRDPGPSGMSAAIVNAQGGYGAVIVSAANLNIVAENISIPKGTSLVLLQNEVPEPVNLAVAQRAKDVGAEVWLNAAPARRLGDDLLNAVDLLIVNRVEAAFYLDIQTSIDTLTTRGSDGVSFCGKSYDAFAVDVISTHGAGDMFVGALAAEVSSGRCIADALGFAQAAAALHVSSDPERRHLVTRARIIAFLDAQASL